ncbi:hypothetical protein GOBAR_AA34867 [Gossypium barbadense]|uniref:Uncharacterized protein n=1 Tax=Gossypium barbadense TaxID=3634 RepID=A0A2P5W3Y8_GOSBA|nr:hypothetical protein GOBAR_AA34867 [Gossypium barbadense]
MLDAKPITVVYGKKTHIRKESTSKVVQDDVLVIKVPSPFKYKDDQRVPWRYDYEVVGSDASNISILSCITQNRRCYKPNMMGKEPLGLGYKPMRKDVERMCKERRVKRLAYMAGKKVVKPPLICPRLSKTFYSVGFEH